ncbi:hypothetical protein ACFLWJ_01825 [Chloroflexota bacterium]
MTIKIQWEWEWINAQIAACLHGHLMSNLDGMCVSTRNVDMLKMMKTQFGQNSYGC